MSLPKKGLRSLKVNDAEYQWTIRKRPTYWQAAFKDHMILAVQTTGENARTILIVDLGVSRSDNLIDPHQTMITPSVVRKIIRAAINDGWNPNGKGKFAYSYQIPKT